MGTFFYAICKSCGTTYRANTGGIHSEPILHCEVCGSNKTILSEDLDENIRKGHLKWVYLNYPQLFEEEPSELKGFSGLMVDSSEYDQAFSRLAGTCDCGGKFSRNASIRCPKCRSTDYERDRYKPSINYD
jgi:hypothetical protein